MKAAVFMGTGDIRVMDVPKPGLGPGDVLVKVAACGICGTDIHIFSGAEGAAKTVPPTILGHEFAGVIEAVGRDVTSLKAGDRVCVDPNDMCGACISCKSGQGHYCTDMVGYGTTADGGFAQYCRVPAKQAYRLADSVPFQVGCMAEPVSCCLHGIDMCGIRPGSTVLVIGGGAIGQIMAQLARLSGAAAVILSEPVEKKRTLALSLGASHAIDPTEEDPAAQLARLGLACDVVIECVGRRETMCDAIRLAANRATVMLFGLGHPDDEIPIKPFELFKKELTLRASYINPYTMDRAVRLLNSGVLHLQELISCQISLEELGETLGSKERFAGGKVIVDPTI